MNSPRRLSLYRLVKFFMTCLVMGLAMTAKAGFQFYSVNVNPVVLTDDLPDEFEYEFTASFNSYCTDGCIGYQDYGLGLSDFDGYLGIGELKEFMGPEVYATAPSYIGGSNQNLEKIFPLGSYTATWTPHSNQQSPPEMTVFYSVTLKKAGLDKLYQNGSNLDFYIRGVDFEGTQYYDHHYVEIPLEKPPIVKIVGLDDVVIDASSSMDGYYQHQEAFCVYVSESPHAYTLSVKTENNLKDAFYLAPGEASGVDNAYLPYSVAFVDRADNRTSWISAPGEYPAEFTGSSDESCSSENIQVRVRVNTENADKMPMGVYEDRMYITVAAQ